MTTITIVEDNDTLRDLTVKYLKSAGYRVYGLQDAEELFTQVHHTDIYIVDLNLPEMSGYELIEGIRTISDSAGVIILSARTKVCDIVQGYDVGADVYLSKPCDPAILLATIQRLERKRDLDNPTPWDCIIDLMTSEAVGLASRCVLSARELNVLQKLAIAGDRGLERYEIAEAFGIDLDNNAKAINVRISRLRNKLSHVWSVPHIIETRHGFGYRLCHTVHFATL